MRGAFGSVWSVRSLLLTTALRTRYARKDHRKNGGVTPAMVVGYCSADKGWTDAIVPSAVRRTEIELFPIRCMKIPPPVFGIE